MFFASDNAGPAHPAVLDALIAANDGHAMPYGTDPLSEAVTARIRDIFEAPQAAVYLVATGTAANALSLACLGQPWQTVFCTDVAHIHEDECAAPEFYSGGAKLTLVDNVNGKMPIDGLTSAIGAEETRGVHGVQRGPVSITQTTEKGTLYTLDEIAKIARIAKSHGLPLQMDGARFTNALVALGCTPAEMTWRAGIDALSFGGTKNGLMGVEAVVLFNPDKAWEFELRRKRGAHLFSKHRYLAAQMQAYLEGDRWLDMARAANAAAAIMAEGLAARPDTELLYPVEANILFPRFPRKVHRRLHDAGARYYLWDGTLDGDGDTPLTARLVADWTADATRVQAFLDAMGPA
jgi:threonine aldolase